MIDNRLDDSPNNRWMIQVPRIFHVFKKLGKVNTFQDMLDNIFKPLFEVTINPDSDPKLAAFLLSVAGFDSVDDESKIENEDLFVIPEPSKVGFGKEAGAATERDNPPYSYYAYYM